VAEVLERCVCYGPDRVVKRQLEFKPDYPLWRPPPSTARGLRQTLQLNEAIAGILWRIGDRSAPLGGSYRLLGSSEQIEGVNRKIALALALSSDGAA
jgi:hypothetical protein